MRKGLAVLVWAAAAAACGGSSTSPSASYSPPVSTSASGSLLSLLTGLPNYLPQEIANLQSLLPTNPQSAPQIQAKITMLQSPSLIADIYTGQWWVDSSVSLASGAVLPAVTVFPQAQLRAEAQQELDIAKRTVPILEAFIGAPFPSPSIRMWYGFTIGNRSSNGILYMEDRTTYESRTGPDRFLPYDSIVSHEVAHSYIGHESLNQFLELYAYNMIVNGSANLASWTLTRGWTPGLASNTGSSAILDIYQMVGLEPMRRGYRALAALHPAYGAPLSAAATQAFLDQMPAEFRAQVAAKLARVQ